jgi:hypothetical protein
MNLKKKPNTVSYATEIWSEILQNEIKIAHYM